MSSYIRKFIGFLVVIYAFFILSTVMNTVAGSNTVTEEKHIQEKNKKDNIAFRVNEPSKKLLNANTNKKHFDTSEFDTPNIIARNIHTMSNMLSSSPSELADQAKSYALGKLNSVASFEAQKWLSQFGTARISFGLDKKGTLENSAIDLLLPLYDNKKNWLFFSQLGYRNRDSRNTINIGLGGRYFDKNWMYGLNTFYDHDLTGKNQRLGLGGEVWGDYVKFSANAYYRLSDWQKSQNFNDYQERPANGYDINGEFFLPAYPNIGAKLAYEKYFGDNVTLFNRDTKQKNPGLAKIGVTYTPIPLITMGMDYKQGENGNTETQFLANLNYKFGIPFGTQLSPDSVTEMRTLTGSRYDLVERNYNIILDHQKKLITQLSLPEVLVGYSHQQHDISANISTNSSIKQIYWTASKEFEENGGKLFPKVGKSIQITLPRYLSGGNNNYPISAFAEFDNKQKSKPEVVQVIVTPYKVKTREEANFLPSGPLPANGSSFYTINPIITFDKNTGNPVKNAIIDNVQWITEPPEAEGDKPGLKLSWNKADKLTTDENGYLTKTVTLKSTKKIETAKVYLKMEDASPQLVGIMSFTEDKSKYHIENKQLSVDNPGPLIAGEHSKYTYTATVINGSGGTVSGQEIDNVEWSAKDKDGKEVPVNPIKIDGKFKTDGQGQLQATLSSLVPLSGVVVSLSIEKNPAVSAQAVSFDPAKIKITSSSTSPILVNESYTLTATVIDATSGKETGEVQAVNWNVVGGKATITPTGINTATLTSSTAQKVSVEASIANNAFKSAPFVVEFNWPAIQHVMLSPKTPNNTKLPGEAYELTAIVNGADGKSPYTGNKIPFKWSIKPPISEGLSLSPSGEVTDVSDGKLTVSLTSDKDKPLVTGAEVCLSIVSDPQTSKNNCSKPVNFISPPVDFEIKSVEVYAVEVNGVEKTDFDLKKYPLTGNGRDKYKYRALVTHKNGNILRKQTFSDVEWTRDQDQISTTDLLNPQPDKNKEKDPLTTDEQGFLYATLDSNVGVYKDINVTLTIPNQKGEKEPQTTSKDYAVTFVPEPKQAVMFVYNTNKPINVNNSKIFTTEYHPANIFEGLGGQLGADTSKMFTKGEVYYEHFDDKDNYFTNPTVDVGDDHKGPIVFWNPGKSKITAKVTKGDGTVQSYYYHLHIIRDLTYVQNSLGHENLQGYHLARDGVTCESGSGSDGSGTAGSLISPYVADFVKSSGEYAIDSEFENLYEWGLFDAAKHDVQKNNLKYKVLASKQYPGIYTIFDQLTEQSDDNDSGLLVCKVSPEEYGG
ncbi:inverse autotransporter beta domain-containing protein [Xenorhabdus khoisanae]|uniref:inverse autotransporter beta domain-containing protein n=1 Tax=Xenorhabdus khoisanae TaxID=880157 RepID=UPI00069ECCF7|nr:inverse autotransporter beta-barrel domain-containing protein [Xenorhabdus khoisanae]